MGTRGFIGFVADGAEKIAYNHYDSYPSGLGEGVLDWLHRVMSVELGEQALREAVRNLRVVAPTSEPSDEDIARLSQYHNPSVGERRERPDWYQLLRETQGEPAAMLAAGVIEDASSFPCDSLFAEWGYVVDLDANAFEVYRGFQCESHDSGRFAHRSKTSGADYYPCALVESWPLSSLPTTEEFLNQSDSWSR